MKIVVKISRESGERFRAWCPALPGCVVCGRSREEAIAKLEQAVCGYVASLDAVMPRTLERKVLAS